MPGVHFLYGYSEANLHPMPLQLLRSIFLRFLRKPIQHRVAVIYQEYLCFSPFHAVIKIFLGCLD